MRKIDTPFADLYIVENNVFSDSRGILNKYYQKSAYENMGIYEEFKEILYTVSYKDVVRGMHFQKPPAAHAKLVRCMKGKILDVVLDLRKGSATYGEAFSVVLSEENKKALYIPIGFAHGYKVLEDNAITLYHVTSEFSPDDDGAIRWNSFGYDWGIQNPTISEKDKTAIAFSLYDSPFE